ncbi:MAG: nucleoside recognition protein [Clostridium sp.]
MKKSILPVLLIIVLFFLLLFPSLSFEGAKTGLLLWFNIVFPTLFPFMLCSGLLVAHGGAALLIRPFAPLLKRFHLSKNGGYTWLCGLLCGYPMGAKTTADFIKNDELSPMEGRRLLAMSGCPSPMFLTGYIRNYIPGDVPLIYMVVALYLPILCIAGISSYLYKMPADTGSHHLSGDAVRTPDSFDEILMNSLEIMVKIGGYIMIFSILGVFINHFFPDCFSLKPILLGFIEMTTGIQSISRSMSGRSAVAAMMASAAFGGLSGVFQTNTVIKNAGLSIRHYVFWKLFHAALTGIIIIILL